MGVETPVARQFTTDSWTPPRHSGCSGRVSFLHGTDGCGQEEADGAVNAWSERLCDQAMDEARIAESRYLTDVPPLLGLPIAATDRHSMWGRAFSDGLLAQRDRIAESDHPMIERTPRCGRHRPRPGDDTGAERERGGLILWTGSLWQ